jgi:hypothetical protein
MTTTGPLFADVVVVSCSMHPSADKAWAAAAAHVALNPTKCHPSMTKATIPAALVGGAA